MSGRELILGRIKRALAVPAPKRHVPAVKNVPPPQSVPEQFERTLPVLNGSHGSARAWLPPVGESRAAQEELFAAQCELLRAEFVLCADWDDAQKRLATLAQEGNWRTIAAHPGALTDAAVAALALPVMLTTRGYDVTALEKCDAALTECDALVAQTGSVLVTSRSAGGRTLSALAPHHVVLARGEQIVPDLTAAFDVLRERYGEDFPSLMSFITGPSRTGDIERILVLGAHGPKRLTILCV